MEAMGTSNIPLVAAFFIGLMMAISPCPLATNIAAIAYTSKKLGQGRRTIITGFVYTLGRMFTYIVLASSIVYVGLGTMAASSFLQGYGDRILGPLLIVFGLIMLEAIKLDFIKGTGRLNSLKKKLSEKGYVGSFFLGVIFAMAFCPFSAVLFFGMLLPLAFSLSDGVIIPAVFAFGTGLPVIFFSFVLTYSVSKLGDMMNKVQVFELWMRRVVSAVFIIVGAYYTILVYVL